MKKYLLIFVTTILLALSLSACGDNGSVEAPPATDMGDVGEDGNGIPMAPPGSEDGNGDGLDQSEQFFVVISINPEFKLHLNRNMEIIEVECLNQDAESLYPQMNLIGKTYEDGLEEILTKAIQNNYLSNNGKIQVNVKRSGGEFEQQERDYFDSMNQSTLDKVRQTSGLAINFVSQVTFDAEDYIIEEYNADGYLVHFAYIHGDGNLDHEYSRKYLSYSPLTYEETYHQPQEGTKVYTLTCDNNGVPVLKSWKEDNGDLFEDTLDNGQVTYRKHYDSVGVLWEEEWFTGDKVTRKLEYRYNVIGGESQGTKEVIEYVNDKKVKSTLTWDNGDTQVCTYENDKMTSKDKVYVSGSHDYWRYENDILVYYRGEFSDGTYSVEEYNNQGVLLYREGYIVMDGHKYTTTYTVGSNGLYTYSVHESNDGYKEEIFYDAQGKPSSWTERKSDGTISSGTYDANGNRIPQP